MKTTALIIKEGRVCCTDKEVPEDKCVHLPREFFATDNDYEEHYKGFIECGNRYRTALQLIKDNAVLIHEDDQDKAYGLIMLSEGAVNESVFYPVSVEVEIVTKGVCCSPIPPNINHHNDCDKCEGYSELKLARIVEEPVSKDQVYGGKKGLIKGTVFKEEPVEKKPEEKDVFIKYLDEWIQLCHDTINKGSDDVKIIKAGNTMATLERVKDKFERVYVTRVNSQVEDQEPKDVISYFSNMAIEKLQSEWVFYIQNKTMKTTALIIKEGRVCCTDKEVPEKPIACSVCEHEDILKVCACEIANKKYRDTIQRIKDNAVPFDESQQASFRLMLFTKHAYTKDFVIKDDTFYPVSVEVEIGDGELCKYCNKSKDGHYHDTVLNRYACKAGDLVAALCTFHPQTVAGIVEEPVKLPFKEFKVKAGSIKIEKRTPVVDIQVEEPVENKPDFDKEEQAAKLDRLWYEFLYDVGSNRHLLAGETEPEQWEIMRKKIEEKWTVTITRNKQ